MENIFGAFEYGIPAAIIIAIYLIIMKIIDAKKEKRQAVINSGLIDSFTKLNSFLEYFTKDIIEKDQDKCECAIKSAFSTFAGNITKYAITVVINNNVEENRESIIENIKHVVSTEYWSIYTHFSYYKTSEQRLCNYLEESWKDIVVNDLIAIIFNRNKTKEEKIYNINNKIHIESDSFCIHIINRYERHH